MTSTATARCAGALLRTAIGRAATIGGLTLLAWCLGSAVADAATNSASPMAHPVANDAIQSQESDLIARLLSGLLTTPDAPHAGGTTSSGSPSLAPVAGSAADYSASDVPTSRPAPASPGGASGSGSSFDGGTWTGSTSVSVPTDPAPS
ncbi:MAG: hypothetical protein JOZ47_10555, partial [Kutzneria sp.]|nr:hypothetical protein [Kutzneria sp.]